MCSALPSRAECLAKTGVSLSTRLLWELHVPTFIAFLLLDCLVRHGTISNTFFFAFHSCIPFFQHFSSNILRKIHLVLAFVRPAYHCGHRLALPAALQPAGSTISRSLLHTHPSAFSWHKLVPATEASDNINGPVSVEMPGGRP